MDRSSDKDIVRDVVLLSLLLSLSFTGEPVAQTAGPAKLPEIVVLLPSGRYIGQGQRDAKAFDVSLVVHESKPGGKFVGTVSVPQAPAPCTAVFPITGEMKSDGAVHIDSDQGVVRGCERSFDLKLAGNELHGTLIDAEGAYQVKLKRQ